MKEKYKVHSEEIGCDEWWDEVLVLRFSRNDMINNPQAINKFIEIHINLREYYERIIRSVHTLIEDQTGFFNPETLAKLVT